MPIQNLDKILKEIENLDFSQLKNISSKIKTFSDRQQQQENIMNNFLDKQKCRNDETIKSIDLTHKKDSDKLEKDINTFFEKQKKNNSDILNQYIAEKNTTINTRIDDLSILKKNLIKNEKIVNNTLNQLQDRIIKFEKDIEGSFSERQQQQENIMNNFLDEQKCRNDETIKSIDLTHKKNSEKLEKNINTLFEKQKKDNSKILNEYIAEKNTTINTRIDDLSILKKNLIKNEKIVNNTLNQLQDRIIKFEKDIEGSFSERQQQQEVWKQNVNSMWENSNKMRENSQDLQKKENTTIHQSIKNLENKTQKDLESLKQQNILYHQRIEALSKDISTYALILSSQKKRLIVLGIISFSLIGSLIFIFFNN